MGLLADNWRIKQELNLSESINACTLTKSYELLKVTDSQILRADSDLNLVTLYENVNWSHLYPNSIVAPRQKVYIEMKSGIFTTNLDEIEN
ncbi:MAG: hypothetical protein JXQ87_01360 [Bacteroidia bacterium]